MLPKQGNAKWKGKDMKTIATTHQCKEPNNYYNHCNIDGHTKYKCWKLHLDLYLRNYKKDAKKKKIPTKDLIYQI